MRIRLAAAFALCVAFACTAGVARADSYSDPCDDAGGAPEICSVDVSYAANGRISFEVDFDPGSPFNFESLAVYVDSRANTGCAFLPYVGIEYALVKVGHSGLYTCSPDGPKLQDQSSLAVE